ncbi:hypothetical protein DIE06_01215 [Burkholderia sp. Bp8998]|nr:hypothetical protein DIE06_01215 [Burkholderia sp. Bp8998]
MRFMASSTVWPPARGASTPATLGQEGACASNARRALTQFTRTSSAPRALAGDLEQHPEWLLPGTASEDRRKHRAMRRDFYNECTDGMPNVPRSSMLVSYGPARCLGQSPSPHVVAPPSRPQSCVARRAS